MQNEKRKIKNRELPPIATIVVVAAIVAYLGLFYSSLLPSLAIGGAETQSRSGFLANRLLLVNEVAEAWFDDISLDVPVQRAAVFAAAVAMLAVAGAAGRLLLRGLRVDATLDRLERIVFSLGIGLAAVSLYTLLVGLVGGLHNRGWFIAPAAGVLVAFVYFAIRHRNDGNKGTGGEAPPVAHEACEENKSPIGSRWLWLGFPFALAILFGSMLPPIEFDVLEYHLQAPKEFFHAGRIEFLPHNVYGNMPLGAEMFSLAAMAVSGDWWWGALVGKTVIGAFAPLTALALFAAGRRFFSAGVGVVAALAYISTPWIIQVSNVGLIDAVYGFYLFMAVYSVLLWPDFGTRWIILAGLFAGAAAAVKYTALPFVVVPMAVAIFFIGRHRFQNRWKGSVGLAGTFLIAAALAGGAWYAKNWVQSGNPVYPMMHGVFDGRSWNDAKAEQWRNVHRPPGFSAEKLADSLARVGWRSEWSSPIIVPLAALTLLVVWNGTKRRRGLVFWLWGYLAFYFLAWWLATHRIDRFLVPVLPIAALLAGVGANWSNDKIWRTSLRVLLIAALAANFLFVTSGASGDIRYFASYRALRNGIGYPPWHRWLNENVRPPQAILAVGDAGVFDLEIPVYYATTFDDQPIERWLDGRTPETFRDELLERNIAYVYVAWDEIARYRSPGNYGFTDFLRPEVFTRLVETGVLGPPLPMLEGSRGEVFPVLASPK